MSSYDNSGGGDDDDEYYGDPYDHIAGGGGSGNVGPGSGVAERIPHYALPNTAHVLPRYANQEQDNVKMSFQVGNFRSLNLLPDTIAPDNLNAMDANHAAANIRAAPAAVQGNWRRIDPKGLFSRFEYQEDESHGLAEKLERAKRLAREDKAKRTHARQFRAGTTSTYEQEKERDLAKENEDLVLNYAPFSDIEDHKRRLAHLHRSKILFGPMVPSGVNKPTSTMNRLHIPEILKALTIEIDQDWEDTEFYIYMDDEDLIVVEFSRASLDNEDGLWAYMNMMLQCNQIVSEYHLSKVVELWNHRPGDGNVYYAFKPPWVKRKASDSYFVLHPERRTYAALREHERRRNASERDRNRKYQAAQSAEQSAREQSKAAQADVVAPAELSALEQELKSAANFDLDDDDDGGAQDDDEYTDDDDFYEDGGQ